jgi:hypothetical protein
MPRGSREHVLYWTSHPRFLPELLALVQPVDCRVTADSVFLPMGLEESQEARLESFGPIAIPGHRAWPELVTWWLRHLLGANTPNWDLALSCSVEGRPGLILVEAKAHVQELSIRGKAKPQNDLSNSGENHTKIGEAIAEAREGLRIRGIENSISRDSHYQLSNRIAFAWKLATLGIPVVLVYLGFIGDKEIAKQGARFDTEAQWEATFRDHLEKVFPPTALSQPIETGAATFWLLCKSRAVGRRSVERQNS